MLGDDFIAALVVGVEDLHHLLGVELEREADRVHQITKESGHWPALRPADLRVDR